jgi:hypothetical protein
VWSASRHGHVTTSERTEALNEKKAGGPQKRVWVLWRNFPASLCDWTPVYERPSSNIFAVTSRLLKRVYLEQSHLVQNVWRFCVRTIWIQLSFVPNLKHICLNCWCVFSWTILRRCSAACNRLYLKEAYVYDSSRISDTTAPNARLAENNGLRRICNREERVLIWHLLKCTEKTTNSVALVRERTILAERPPLVGEVSTNFCGERVPRGQRGGSLRTYSRVSRPEEKH